jgi:hypothetical protein
MSGEALVRGVVGKRTRALFLLLAASWVAGCGEDEGSGTAAPADGSNAEAQEILEVYAEFQEAVLLLDGKGFCDILARDRLEELESQGGIKVECETAASLGFGSLSDEDREAVRSAQDKSDEDDVDIDSSTATVTTPQRQRGPLRQGKRRVAPRPSDTSRLMTNG